MKRNFGWINIEVSNCRDYVWGILFNNRYPVIKFIPCV